MSESVRQLVPAVIFLRSMKPKQRKQLIGHLNKNHLRGLTETAVNIVKGTVALKEDQVKICRRWRKPLKLLALKRYPAKEKKKLLQQGGFLGALLPVLASVLGAVING